MQSDRQRTTDTEIALTWWQYIVVIAISLLVLVGVGWILTTLFSLVTHRSLSPLEILIFGMIFSAIGAFVQVSERRRRQEGARKGTIEHKRQELARAHPELIDMLEILEYNDHTSDGRSFWRGWMQNFVFFALGFVLPVLQSATQHITFH